MVVSSLGRIRLEGDLCARDAGPDRVGQFAGGGGGSDMSKVISVNKMIEDLRSRLPVMKSSGELINNVNTNGS